MPRAIFVKRAHAGGTSSRTYEAYREIEVPFILAHRGAQYLIDGIGMFEVKESYVTADGVILVEQAEDLGDPNEPNYVKWMSEMRERGWSAERLSIRPIPVDAGSRASGQTAGLYLVPLDTDSED